MCNPAVLFPLVAGGGAAAATTIGIGTAASIFASAIGVAASLKKPKLAGGALRIPTPEPKGQAATRAEEAARGRLTSEQEEGKARRRRLRIRGAAAPATAEIGLKIPIT